MLNREQGNEAGKDAEICPSNRQGKTEQKKAEEYKAKNKHKGLHKDRKWDFKGFIICEFASNWTIGRKFAKYEQGGKGRKTKKNEKKKENKEERGKGRR